MTEEEREHQDEATIEEPGEVIQDETVYGCPQDELDGTMSLQIQLVDFGPEIGQENWRYVVATVDDEEDIVEDSGFDELEDAQKYFEELKQDFAIRSEANRVDIRDQHAEAVLDLADEWLDSGEDARLLAAIAVVIGRAQSEQVLNLLRERKFA